MSTPANSTLVSEAASSITLGYCSTSAAGMLFVYYYLSTLDHEFKHYSERKITLATLLYIANRYVPLVYFIYNAPWIPFSSDHQKICAAEMGTAIGLRDLMYIPWAIFSALRAYALQRKLSWAVIVLILSLANIVVDAFMYHWAVSGAIVFAGGINTLTNIGAVRHRVRYDYSLSHTSSTVPFLARIPVIIADIIVVLITWKTQYSTHRLSKNLPNPKKLATIVLHNGTIYFVVLTALNILLLILEYLQIFTDSPVLENNSSDLSLLIEPLTAILVSEFLNDLHEAADKTSGPETLSSVSALEFRIVGSIGASLPGPTDDKALDAAEDNSHEDSEREVDGELEIDEMARGVSEAEV
ncbi:hypothetical protein ONZ51_g2418 [Trametes cubensis]|uniref:DUF6533 domain-containing protein n=1 Tax=Trametes cubensis TaxID=1111947 RepID=A0AAD7U208_9APHY|nr:hypothetical protein ONZ51_g2418 [Trametes cubensis]